MTECEVPRVPELHPALSERFSPVAFDSAAMVTSRHVDVLLDAARLAPSAGNSQPWTFIVGRRGDPIHQRMVRHLARSSVPWATAASLLVVNLAKLHVEGTTDLEYSEFSRYDLGQAVAHMTVQGLAMGLAARQFRAFDRDALAREFDVPPQWELTSMTAFGTAAPGHGTVTSGDTSRSRLTRDEVTWARA